MFDFSASAIALGFASALLHSVPPRVLWLIALAAVLGLVAVLFRGRVRFALLVFAVAVGGFGLVYQAAVAEGALRTLVRDHALALKAERERADLADAITRELAEQATNDLAAEQAGSVKLKDLTDALAQDPRRAGACVPRDLARRLRAL